MKFISPNIHALLDYFTVFLFALTPTVLDFSEVPAYLCWALATGHLLVTLSTNYKFGLLKIIPFPVHGILERVIGPLLIALPFVAGFHDQIFALYFFVAYGLIIILVTVVTDYHAAA